MIMLIVKGYRSRLYPIDFLPHLAETNVRLLRLMLMDKG
jgi:hypothetical protein